jgi:hypothetical protein
MGNLKTRKKDQIHIAVDEMDEMAEIEHIEAV